MNCLNYQNKAKTRLKIHGLHRCNLKVSCREAWSLKIRIVFLILPKNYFYKRILIKVSNVNELNTISKIIKDMVVFVKNLSEIYTHTKKKKKLGLKGNLLGPNRITPKQIFLYYNFSLSIDLPFILHFVIMYLFVYACNVSLI